MGDEIQKIMELMIPEMDDLQERNIFNGVEIKSIISRRRQHEYSMFRKPLLKEDVLRYIKYEINLDNLIKQRKLRNNIGKSGIGDFCCMKRILFIYERSLRKFKDDLSLWITAIDYAIHTKSTKQISKLFARVLQLHPRKVGFWIKAASYEFSRNNNMTTARVLMQRALRINKTESELWIEYFKLEFLYLDKLHKRRAVLGIDSSMTPETKEDADESNMNDYNSDSDSDSENNNIVLDDDDEDQEQEQVVDTNDNSNTETDVLYNGAILKIIYSSAIKNNFSNCSLIEFKTRVLNLCSAYLSSTNPVIIDVAIKLVNFVFNDLETSHQGDHQFYEAKASFVFQNSSFNDTREEGSLLIEALGDNSVKKSKRKKKSHHHDLSTHDTLAIEVLQTGLTLLKSPQMLNSLVGFYFSRINDSEENEKVALLDACLAVLREESKSIDVSEETCKMWIQLLELSNNDAELKTVFEYMNELHPTSQALWLLRIDYEADLTESLDQISDIFHQAIKVLHTEDTLNIWLKYINIIISNGSKSSKSIIKLFQKAIKTFVVLKSSQNISIEVRDVKDNCIETLINNMLRYSSSISSKTLKFSYKSLKEKSIPTVIPLNCYNTYIELLTTPDMASSEMSYIRQIYEEASKHYGDVIQIWLDFLHFEKKFNRLDIDFQQKLIWKACKHLNSVDRKQFEKLINMRF